MVIVVKILLFNNIRPKERLLVKQKVKISRKGKAIQTKKRIYESAEQLFSEHGFEAVNVDDIVKKAGVAKGSFYVHFESKDNLIVLIINDYVGRVDMDYKSYLESLPIDMPPYEIFLSLIGRIADVIAEDIGSEKMGFLYRVQLDKKLSMESVMGYNRELYRMFFEIIEDGIHKNVFHSKLPADEIARQFVMAYRGLTYEWCVRYPEFNLKIQALRLFEILLTGISK